MLTLDEIGELPLDIQPFLLRVLEDRAVQRIGEARARPVDVRLVVSTNRDLRAEVDAGRFRRDLYYRIGAVALRVPPLRERGDDALMLLEYFNAVASERSGRDRLEFTPEVLDALRSYRWPGNVRELKNLVERLHVLASGPVRLIDLPPDILQPVAVPEAPPAPAAVTRLEDAELVTLKNALEAEQGNLTRVAQRLGISRPTLYRKLDHYDIRRTFR
ncbi:DNA-binding NtrC family response regulator [Amaricoccus macauensis]|uniref:DNA-binding NtrC family response regulator n=1 Tax=Amaricoccus macauensis TaxID=57001 RepID=A0A840SRM7_9RHOB|nr:DNA-binding NtrC family response regulator [Amaricoccus macauensis]